MSNIKLTPADLEAAVKETLYHVWAGTTLTSCVLVLHNGFTVTGESACVDPANFNEALGRKYAREQAIEKLWPLLGYELRARAVREGIL